MSLEKAEKYLEKKGFLDHVIELEASTATVTEAAEALHVEPGMIAKTMSFLQNDKAVLILTEGTARVDNRKYKDTFHIKAKMIPFDEVENIIGHAPGGVCPFGINEGIEVYLDESLKQFTTVYPAAGNDHSAVKLTISELEQVAFACGTRLIGIDAGHNDNFISNFLLDFAKSGQIVQHCIFIVCGTWTNDCEKFIRFACKNIFKFFVAGIFDCLKFCINRKLIADFFRSW